MEQLKAFPAGATAQRVSHQRPTKMAPQWRWFALLAVACLAVIGGIAAYIWFSGGDGRASTAIQSPSLALLPGDTRTLMALAADESEVRFIIDETLLGNPKTVIGTTQEVAGELLLDLDQPANSVLGIIRINLRTLETDNEFRTRALRGQILQAERPEFEFATFTPITLSGLPESIETGDQIDFRITGNLNLHGVNREVTFDARITAVSQNEVVGSANAVVLYRDFGLSIPEAPGVANVADEVRLEIDFVAGASASGG
jgi:polyisoprenoid-binding protein YceI